MFHDIGLTEAYRGTSFRKNIIDAFYEGMKHRPDSTFAVAKFHAARYMDSECDMFRYA